MNAATRELEPREVAELVREVSRDTGRDSR